MFRVDEMPATRIYLCLQDVIVILARILDYIIAGSRLGVVRWGVSASALNCALVLMVFSKECKKMCNPSLTGH